MQEKLWVFRPSDLAMQTDLSRRLSISPVTASILLARGVTTAEEATRWMTSPQDGLHDPWLIPDMAIAVERLHEALCREERVCFYGDYDVDGVSATSLYLSFYQGLGGMGAPTSLTECGKVMGSMRARSGGWRKKA